MKHFKFAAFAVFALNILFSAPAFSQTSAVEPSLGCLNVIWADLSDARAVVAQALDLAQMDEMRSYRLTERVPQTGTVKDLTSCWDSIFLHAPDSMKSDLQTIKDQGIMSDLAFSIAHENQLDEYLEQSRKSLAEAKAAIDQIISLTAEMSSLTTYNAQQKVEIDSLKQKHEEVIASNDSLRTELDSAQTVLRQLKADKCSSFLQNDSIAFAAYVSLMDTAAAMVPHGKISLKALRLLLKTNSEDVRNRKQFDSTVAKFWKNYHNDTGGMLASFTSTINNLPMNTGCAELILEVAKAAENKGTDGMLAEIDKFWACVGGVGTEEKK